MPKPNPFIERAPAIRACADAAALLRGLQDDTMLPTKAYNKASEERRSKWSRLAELAEAMAKEASVASARRITRPKAAKAPVAAEVARALATTGQPIGVGEMFEVPKE